MNLEKILQRKPDEEIVQIYHAFFLPFVPKLIPVALWFVVPFFFLFPLSRQGIAGMVLFAALTLSALVFGWRLMYRWRGSVFVVTDKRVFDIEQKGFFDRLVSEVSLDRVDDVTYEVKGMFATLFGYGSVRVIVQGTGADLEVRRVREPARLHHLLNDLRHVQTSPEN